MRLENRQERKYGAILIDPPWPFKTFTKEDAIPSTVRKDGVRQAADGTTHYATMKIHQIAGLPVPELAGKHCAVFLWLSDSLPWAAEFLARAWDMKIATNPVFIWVKPSIGMGYWTRKRAECCALLKKGSPKRKSGGVDQVIWDKRREHSRKPDETYNRIEALVDGPYLEMFARQTAPGWDSWGNEAEKFSAAIQQNLELEAAE